MFLCMHPNVFVYVSRCSCVCIQMFLCMYPDVLVYLSTSWIPNSISIPKSIRDTALMHRFSIFVFSDFRRHRLGEYISDLRIFVFSACGCICGCIWEAPGDQPELVRLQWLVLQPPDSQSTLRGGSAALLDHKVGEIQGTRRTVRTPTAEDCLGNYDG